MFAHFTNFPNNMNTQYDGWDKPQKVPIHTSLLTWLLHNCLAKQVVAILHLVFPFSKAILETGRTSGQTVRRMFIPHWRPQGEEPLGEEEEGEEDKVGTPQPGQGKEKDGAGKPADKKVKSADSKSSKASRGGGQKGKPPTSGKKKQSRDEAELAVVQQESKEDGGAKEEDVFLKRNWYNVVCYGLPNLMVANV